MKRVIAKLSRLWFCFFYKRKFKECGKKTFICSPFRLDGESFIVIGSDTFVQRGSWLYCGPVNAHPGQLKIGSKCIFGYNNHITCVRDVTIEDNVLTANNVYISDNLHSYEDTSVPIMYQPVRFKNIVWIGQGSWIGENVSIIGAKVGRNCVIGANSVVTRDIPDYSVAVGSPAVVIKQYDQTSREWVKKKLKVCGK